MQTEPEMRDGAATAPLREMQAGIRARNPGFLIQNWILEIRNL
jgi:hypothetical protein